MARIRGIANLEKTTTGQPLLKVDGSNTTILSFTGNSINFAKEGIGTLLQLANPNKLQFTANAGLNYIIGTDSAAGSDNRGLIISSNSTELDTRGAFVRVYGNEFVGNSGEVHLVAGNVSGSLKGRIVLQTSQNDILFNVSGNNDVVFNTNATQRLRITGDGFLKYSNFSGIGADTVDGFDNSRLVISGGGATSSIDPTRGAGLHLSGNEDIFPGLATLAAGNVDGGRLVLITYGSQELEMWTNNAQRWTINTSGHLINASGLNIGSSEAPVGTLFATTLSNAGILDVTTTADAPLFLGTNSLRKWGVTSAGHLLPQANASYDIGSDSARVRSIYASTELRVNDIRLYGNIQGDGYFEAPGNLTIGAGSSGDARAINFQTSTGTNRWVIESTAGHLIPGAGSTYDIGSSAARIRTVYADSLVGPEAGGTLSTLANNTFLNGRNFANTLDVGLVKINTSDDTIINSNTGKAIKLTNTAGSAFVASFDYTNQSFTTSATSGISRIIQTSATVDARWTVDPTASRSTFGTVSSHDLCFNTNNLNRWHIDTAGRFVQDATNGTDIRFNNQTGSLQFCVGAFDPKIQLKNFGDSSSYKALFIGSTNSTPSVDTSSLWFNVDLSANPSSSYIGTGNEYFFRNSAVFNTPDAANTGYHTYFTLQDGDIALTKSPDAVIRTNTSDGLDNHSLNITAGGAWARGNASRGGSIELYGNEHPWLHAGGQAAGTVWLRGGNVSSGHVILETTNASSEVRVSINGTLKWKFNSAGAFTPNTNSTNDLGTSSLRVRKLYVDKIDTSDIIDNEFPSGDMDGINTVYTLAFACISTSLKIYYNGLRLAPGAGNDYTVTGAAQFTLNFPPQTGDILLVDYRSA